MAEFSENRHISNLINMSCKVGTLGLTLSLSHIIDHIMGSC